MTAALAELEIPCARCDHQGAVHTGGANDGGWAIYDKTWANASGHCSTPGCGCPGRVMPADIPVDEAAALMVLADAGLLPSAANEGTQMDITEILTRELTEAITHDVTNKPRSLQKAIGPSEVGEECQRKLAYKLFDWDPKPNTSMDPLPSFVGTAAHEAIAAALERMNTDD